MQYNILFITKNTHTGGAERQMLNLITYLCENVNFNIYLLVLRKNSLVSYEIPNKVNLIQYNNFKNNFAFLRLIRSINIHTIISFQPYENLVAFAISLFIPTKLKLIGGIRNSNMDLRNYNFKMRILYKIQYYIHNKFDKIVANSYAGKNYYSSIGYTKELIDVIHNGIDCNYFNKNTLRNEHINKKTFKICKISRLDPMKGHLMLLKAINVIRTRIRKKIELIFVGNDNNNYKSIIKKTVNKYNLNDIVTFRNADKHVISILSEMDLIICNSLYGEGFPNILAESILCKKNVIASNCGDTNYILKEKDYLFEINDQINFQDILMRTINNNIKFNHETSRQHIIKNYNMLQICKKYEKLICNI